MRIPLDTCVFGAACLSLLKGSRFWTEKLIWKLRSDYFRFQKRLILAKLATYLLNLWKLKFPRYNSRVSNSYLRNFPFFRKQFYLYTVLSILESKQCGGKEMEKREKKDRKKKSLIQGNYKPRFYLYHIQMQRKEGREREKGGRGNAFKCSRSTVQKMTGTLTTGLDHGAQTVTVKIINV